MPRETLPSGASLLALAGSNLARAPLTPQAPSGESAAARPSTMPRQRAMAPASDEIAALEVPRVGAILNRKQKVNARISAALLEEVRDCVVALSGPPHGMTMDQFAEEAYRRELERLKRKHGQGQTFERRPYNPRPGRRVS